MRSRVEDTLKNRAKLLREAGGYRLGPDPPLSDEELQAKLYDCVGDLFEPETREGIFNTIASLDRLEDIRELTDLA